MEITELRKSRMFTILYIRTTLDYLQHILTENNVFYKCLFNYTTQV